jgi:drug/metabolite transporter (DMT)-like permease
MKRIVAQVSNLLDGLTGKIYLLLAIIIFGSSNSITRQLTEVGKTHLIQGSRNPISFCNVLFVGNLCALLVLFLIYGRQWKLSTLRQLSWKDWLSLIGVAILSVAIAPSLVFIALSLTMVTNVVLIGRIESPLVLALSVWLLRERVNFWAVAGAIVSLGGVAIAVFLQGLWENPAGDGVFITVGRGEILAAAGAAALAVSTIISKVRLRQIPLGIFAVFRTAMGTIVFLCIVLRLYGSQHFIDVFSPFLWQWMLIYGAVIVVLGQLCWFTGLKTSTASEVSFASSFTPIIGILAAFLILGEVPSLAQYIGGSVILTGIFLSQIGVRQQTSSDASTSRTVSSDKTAKEMETGIGFK